MNILKRLYDKYFKKEKDFFFDDIESIECVGNFEDEYVYDIEMLDESHTLIANDILIHNSNYLCFDLIFESLGIMDHQDLPFKVASDFIEYYFKEKLNPKYDQYLTENIRRRNGVSTMKFEHEATGGFAVYISKKKYVLHECWEDGNFLAYKNKLKATGIEIVQQSTSELVRTLIKDTIIWFLIEKRGRITLDEYMAQMKKIFDIFASQPFVDMCKVSGIKKYPKYVANDTETLEFNIFRTRNKKGGMSTTSASPQIRGSAKYNYLIKKNGLLGRYPLLRPSDKVLMFYDVHGEPFCIPNEDYYPKEVAPDIDIRQQFHKLVYIPLERVFVGYPALDSIFVKQLKKIKREKERKKKKVVKEIAQQGKIAF